MPVLGAFSIDLDTFGAIGAAVVLVGLLVFIHEFGHFIVAKACGVGVPVFSIGFGRRVAGIQIGETDYRVSALPFGGYVLLAGSDPYGYLEDEEQHVPVERRFLEKPVWQRLLVIGAGPAMNLVLPFFVFTALFMAGDPQPASEIGVVDPGSPAAAAGILPGDRIVSIDGTVTPSMYVVVQVAETLGAGEHVFDIERDGARLSLTVASDDPLDFSSLGVSSLRLPTVVGVDDPASPAGRAGVKTGDRITAVGDVAIEDWVDLQAALASAGDRIALTVEDEDGEAREVSLRRDGAWRPIGIETLDAPSVRLGLLPGDLFVGALSTRVEDRGGLFTGCRPQPADPPTPAKLAGFQDGDRFLAIDGQPVDEWGDVLAGIRDTLTGEETAATARPAKVEVVRAGEVLTLTVEPKVVVQTERGDFTRRAMIGVGPLAYPVGGPEVLKYYTFPAAFQRASAETVAIGRLMLETLGKMATGVASIRENMGGPIEMGRQAFAAAKQGLFSYARLMGVLSISLGIVNLLPVPVLDGGQLLFFSLELIRGRPVSVALRERAQQIGVIFMVLLMLSVLVMDIQRWIGVG